MKTLKKFEFKEFGTRSLYEWDNLLDGQIYEAHEGEDFNCATNTFTMMLRDRSKKRNKGVRINVSGEEGSKVVTFQAIEMTEEQLADRAEKSRIRKANLAAKRAAKLSGSGESGDENAGEENGDVEQESEAYEEKVQVEEPKPTPKKGKSR